MQYPIGVRFNPQSVRNEMINFFDIALSPIAVSKFTHTIASGYVISSLFVMGVSAWFILKNRDFILAKRSMVIGASFGLLVSIFLILTGDESAYEVAQKQPVKLAAMEGLYDGERRAGLTAFGILNPDKRLGDKQDTFYKDITIPYVLSILGHRDLQAFVPGLNDLVFGNKAHGIKSAKYKIQKGKEVRAMFEEFQEALKQKDSKKMDILSKKIDKDKYYFGYGFLKKPSDIVPPIGLTFYTFHLMVGLGFYFFLLFLIVLYLLMANDIKKYRKLLWICLFTIPLGYIAAEAGWIVAEVGRQPWAIQDLMPTSIAATPISSTNVKISFWLFAVLFTTLLIAEVKIMLKQISIGFKGEN